MKSGLYRFFARWWLFFATRGGSMTTLEYQVERVSTLDPDANGDPTGRWADHVRDNHGSVGLAFTHADFIGKTQGQKVGALQIVEFQSTAIDYRRNQRHVRNDGDYSARVVVPLDGAINLAQRESKVTLHPGDLGFLHWGFPMHLTHGDRTRALIFSVPEGSIDPKRAREAPLLLKKEDTLAGLLTSHVRQITSYRETMDTHEFVAAFSALLTQLEAALCPKRANELKGRAKLAEEVRRYMELNARDRDLTPESVAKHFHVGSRTLHRALEETLHITPGRLLRNIRLAQAHQEVSTVRTINMNEIATKAGYDTTRAFSEAFKRRYGLTPAQLREALFGNVDGTDRIC